MAGPNLSRSIWRSQMPRPMHGEIPLGVPQPCRRRAQWSPRCRKASIRIGTLPRAASFFLCFPALSKSKPATARSTDAAAGRCSSRTMSGPAAIAAAPSAARPVCFSYSCRPKPISTLNGFWTGPLSSCPHQTGPKAKSGGGETETITRRNASMIVGSGDYRYRVNADWAKLPEGWSFKEVGGVGVDGKDNVYVFNRGDHPMMVFDRAGNFLRSWGEGDYPRAHGVHVAPDDTMFLTDDGGHFVRKVTLDGKVLLELGVPGKPAPYMSGAPFHRCTHTAQI